MTDGITIIVPSNDPAAPTLAERLRRAELAVALSYQAVAITKATCGEFADHCDQVEVMEAFATGKPLSLR